MNRIPGVCDGYTVLWRVQGMVDFGDGKGQVPATRHWNIPRGRPGLSLRTLMPELGGWVADTAYAAPTARVTLRAGVGGHAKALGEAVVRECARVLDHAVVSGKSLVAGYAVVKDNAVVTDFAKVRDHAVVCEYAHVSGCSKVLDHVVVGDHAYVGGNKRLEGDQRIGGRHHIDAGTPLHDFGDGLGRVPARKHKNGGGMVALTARVDDSVEVGPGAGVGGFVEACERARIIERAVVCGRAEVRGDATVGGTSRVDGNAFVHGHAYIDGTSHVTGTADVGGRRTITNAFLNGTEDPK